MRQIVVVDDDSDILSILSEFLAGEGYEPLSFVSGTRALDHLKQTRPALLITDLLMPGMSGQELIHSAREAHGDSLPIAVMSASANLGAVADLRIQAFLSKPFDLDELNEIIAHCIAAEPVTNANAAPVTGNLRSRQTY